MHLFIHFIPFMWMCLFDCMYATIYPRPIKVTTEIGNEQKLKPKICQNSKVGWLAKQIGILIWFWQKSLLICNYENKIELKIHIWCSNISFTFSFFTIKSFWEIERIIPFSYIMVMTKETMECYFCLNFKISCIHFACETIFLAM